MGRTTVKSKTGSKARTRARTKAKIKTIPWDVTKYLKSEADIANYLEAAFEEGDASLVAAALADVARAKG